MEVDIVCMGMSTEVRLQRREGRASGRVAWYSVVYTCSRFQVGGDEAGQDG